MIPYHSLFLPSTFSLSHLIMCFHYRLSLFLLYLQILCSSRCRFVSSFLHIFVTIYIPSPFHQTPSRSDRLHLITFACFWAVMNIIQCTPYTSHTPCLAVNVYISFSPLFIQFRVDDKHVLQALLFCNCTLLSLRHSNTEIYDHGLRLSLSLVSGGMDADSTTTGIGRATPVASGNPPDGGFSGCLGRELC